MTKKLAKAGISILICAALIKVYAQEALVPYELSGSQQDTSGCPGGCTTTYYDFINCKSANSGTCTPKVILWNVVPGSCSWQEIGLDYSWQCNN